MDDDAEELVEGTVVRVASSSVRIEEGVVVMETLYRIAADFCASMLTIFAVAQVMRLLSVCWRCV